MRFLEVILLLLIATGSVYAGELSENAKPLLAEGSPVMPGTPFLEVTERSFDFGKLTLDRDYEHAFTVKNAGTAILEIEKVTVG